MCVFVIKELLLFLLVCANSVCCSVCADMKLHLLSSVCTQAWRMVTAAVVKLQIALFTHQKTFPGTGKGGAGLKLCFLQALRRTSASFTEGTLKIGEIWLEPSSKDLTIFCRHGTNADNMGYRASWDKCDPKPPELQRWQQQTAANDKSNSPSIRSSRNKTLCLIAFPQGAFLFFYPQKEKKNKRPLWKYLPANLKSKLKSVEADSMTAVSVTGGITCWDWNYAASSQAVSGGDLKRQCLGGRRCLAAVTQTYITRLPGLYVKVLW